MTPLVDAPSNGFDAALQQAIAAAAERIGQSHMPILSAAGHDARRMQQLRSERLNVAASLAKLGAAPATAAFILQFTDFFVSLYEDAGEGATVGIAING